MATVVNGTDQNDELYAGSGQQIVNGGAGDDVIYAYSDGGEPYPQQTETFSAYDTTTNERVPFDENGAVPAGDFTLVATPHETIADDVESAKFTIDGQTVRVENVVPYALSGDDDGDFNPSNLNPGTYELTVEFYSADNAGGDKLDTDTVYVIVGYDGSITISPESMAYFEAVPEGEADDVLEGGAGADEYNFRLVQNGTDEIVAEHTDKNGKINWAGVAGENDYTHDHWTDSIGNDTIIGYSKAEGDTIVVEGHTANVLSITYGTDETGEDYSLITLYSQQGANGGAHDEDHLGTITVYGDKVEEGDIETDAMVNYGYDELVAVDAAAGYTGGYPDAVPTAADEDPITYADGAAVTGTDGDDTVYAGTAHQDVDTGDGDDEIYLGTGRQTVDAGAGDDVITIYGDAGEPEPGVNETFTIVDSETNEEVSGIAAYGHVTTENFSIVATPHAGIADDVESAIFKIDGQKVQTENFVPYSFNGDNNGDFNAADLPPGIYELTVEFYSADNGGGNKLDTDTMVITVDPDGTFTYSEGGGTHTTAVAEGEADDVIEGGDGADTFQFILPLNAKDEIEAEHTDKNGDTNWQGVAGENDYTHEHWVEGVGNDVILDYDKGEGDKIVIDGHTATLVSITYGEDEGGSYSLISLQSQQGANGGAHDEDDLGTIKVYGDEVTEDDLEINAGVFNGIDELYEVDLEAAATAGPPPADDPGDDTDDDGDDGDTGDDTGDDGADDGADDGDSGDDSSDDGDAGDAPDTSFSVYEASGDTLVTADLENGGEVTDLDFTIVGTPTVEGVESAVFYLDGTKYRTENVVPYALFGDKEGNFRAGDLGNGTHTVTVSYYSEDRGKGELLEQQTIEFVVSVPDNPNPNYIVVNGTGDQTEVGTDDDDEIIVVADAGEPDPAQTEGAEGRINPPVDPATTKDTVTGGGGADAFTFNYLLNATAAIMAKHTNADGSIDWQDVAGENDYVHDHWVEGTGDMEVVTDFSLEDGDEVVLRGHTVELAEITYGTDEGGDYSLLSVRSQQGDNGGAHDEDDLGKIKIYGDKVTEDNVTVEAADVFDGIDKYDPIEDQPNVIYGDDTANTLDGTEEADTIHGERDADTLNGNGGGDYLFGDGGKDTLNGDEGDDYLNGGRGRDVMNGGTGDDILDSDAGRDTMTGGEGEDTFRLSDNIKGGTITDWEDGSDLIDFTRADEVEDLDDVTITQVSDTEVELTFESDEGRTVTVDVLSDTAFTLTEEDFLL
ncbi:MAG: calcium-binding protein [Pseudomonadota bacterium]